MEIHTSLSVICLHFDESFPYRLPLLLNKRLIPFSLQDVEQRLRAEQAARNRAENEAAAIKRELDAIMQVENMRID